MPPCPTPAPAVDRPCSQTSATASPAGNGAASHGCRSWMRSHTWTRASVPSRPRRRRPLSRRRAGAPHLRQLLARRRGRHPGPGARRRGVDRAVRRQRGQQRRRAADHPRRRRRRNRDRRDGRRGWRCQRELRQRQESQPGSVKKAKAKASTGTSGTSKATEEVFEPAPGVKIAPPDQQLGRRMQPQRRRLQRQGRVRRELLRMSPVKEEQLVDLERRRDQLVARVAELQWDLGGLVYEMAIRNQHQRRGAGQARGRAAGRRRRTERGRTDRAHGGDRHRRLLRRPAARPTAAARPSAGSAASRCSQQVSGDAILRR